MALCSEEKDKRRPKKKKNSLHTSPARFCKKLRNYILSLGGGKGRAEGRGDEKRREEVGGGRISECDWSCLTLPAESQRDRVMSGKGLPILFLDREIESSPDPRL